jgi:D-threonate/D-erythronate kinase
MNPLLMAVIADDLTGVCDTGAQFASAGLRTVGSVDWEFKSKEIPQVLLVNTQSRSMGREEASRILAQAVRGLRPFEPKWFFKKIDTALRGNIAIEVFSMMEALGRDLAFYIASIPGAGRTTVGGCQYFHGVPMKDSIHGEDRLNPNPIRTSSNVELLSEMAGLTIETVGLNEVRSGTLDILRYQKRGAKQVIVFDSETDEDNDLIARASMKIDPSTFFYVGSFGLSSALGRSLSDSLKRIQKPDHPFHPRTIFNKNKRVLVVSGSSHPMARSQISHVEKKGMAERFEMEPGDLLRHLDPCISEMVRDCQARWDKLRKVVVTLGEGNSDTLSQSRDLVIALGKGVRSLLDSFDWDGLVLFGGDTGFAVATAAGIKRIEILGNISFVAAYGKPVGLRRPLQVLVTKGGSLGEEDTLEKILNFIDLQT